jgi:hypothetical protein
LLKIHIPTDLGLGYGNIGEHFNSNRANLEIIMKKRSNRSNGFLPSTVKALLLSTPGTVLAMGGEGLAEGFLRLVFWFVVWLIAAADSFTYKTEPWTIARYLLWAVRLSFPVWWAWMYINDKYI